MKFCSSLRTTAAVRFPQDQALADRLVDVEQVELA